MNICVFCSSSNELEQKYYDEAVRLGEWIGRSGHTLVYGGSSSGIMEAIARGVHESGGDILGIVPEFLRSRNQISQYPGQTLFVNDLSERKAMMVEYSEMFLVLPGGIGTLDEMFNTLALQAVDEISSPVIIFNQDGIYNELEELIKKLTTNKFITMPKHYNAHFCTSVEECIAKMNELA